MRDDRRPQEREGLQRRILTGSIALVMLPAAVCVVAGSLLGLAAFRDVGYPDSATLLRVGHFVHSGQIYPDIDQPPYLVSLYGPLTYVLHAVPYALAERLGTDPSFAVRSGVLFSFLLCLALIFVIARHVCRATRAGVLAVLFVLALFPVMNWTTQIRSEFWAIAFTLAGLVVVMRPGGRRAIVAAALLVALAAVVKQTFVAGSIAVFLWLLFSGRAKDAGLWVATVCATLATSYGVALWREPLMAAHVAAVASPLLEYPGALRIMRQARAQLLVPFAVLGGLVALSSRRGDLVLVVLLAVVSWGVAVATIPQVGGNINYFWEPLFVSAVLAAYGLLEVERGIAVPVPARALTVLVFLWLASGIVVGDWTFLQQARQAASSYHERRERWQSFASVVTGREILSTEPSITALDPTPEVPDPYLNTVLDVAGTWSYAPIITRLEEGRYDLVAANSGYLDREGGYRGIPHWNAAVRTALRKSYSPACVFDDIDVWLPLHDRTLLPLLGAVGCRRLADG